MNHFIGEYIMPSKLTDQIPNGDTLTTIGDLKIKVGNFIDSRDWGKFHTPKNLAISISLETNELLEHFQWNDPIEIQKKLEDPVKRTQIAYELADIFIYLLSFARKTKIDLTKSVNAKLEINKQKYPISNFHGIAPEKNRSSED